MYKKINLKKKKIETQILIHCFKRPISHPHIKMGPASYVSLLCHKKFYSTLINVFFRFDA